MCYSLCRLKEAAQQDETRQIGSGKPEKIGSGIDLGTNASKTSLIMTTMVTMEL